LLDTQTHYVYGRVVDPEGKLEGAAVAVAAYANAYGETELVDLMANATVGTHYGLTLPCSSNTTYQLVVLSDANDNGLFDEDEVIGQRAIAPHGPEERDPVLEGLDIVLQPGESGSIPAPVPVPSDPELKRSLFYPAGSIRTLDDPLFDPDIAVLGMYEPAAFSARAPTMFYALEEEVGSQSRRPRADRRSSRRRTHNAPPLSR